MSSSIPITTKPPIESNEEDLFNQGESTETSYSKPKVIKTQPGQTPHMKFKSFAKTYPTPQVGGYQSFVNGMGKLLGLCGVVPCCVCSNPYKTVDQGNVGLVTRFGALARTVEPGLTYVNTWSEKLTRVNIMIRIREIPQQACLTRDNVTVNLTSVLYYNIIDPEKAIFSISDINNAIIERTQTTLRDVVGSRNLQDVIERREEVAESIEHIISSIAADWGVHVESILIKDLSLPSHVSNSLSLAAESKRIGESKIITAKAEVESAKLMRKAADILASKPAMQIRYLDAMQNMARTAGSKVIFMPSSGEVDKLAGQNMERYSNGPSGHASQAPAENISDINEIQTSNTGNSESQFDTRTLALQEAYR